MMISMASVSPVVVVVGGGSGGALVVVVESPFSSFPACDVDWDAIGGPFLLLLLRLLLLLFHTPSRVVEREETNILFEMG